MSSPARVRHNPYAASPSSPFGTPLNGSLKPGSPAPSLSTSFASAAPMTPPTAAAPNVPWMPADSTPREPSFATPQTSEYMFAPPIAMQQLQWGAQEQMYGNFADGYQQPYMAAVDPAIAVMMYGAASAAANAAASMQQYEYVTPQPEAPRVPRRNQNNNSHAAVADGPIPTLDDLHRMQGTLVEQARSASGSSFIQSAVKDSNDPRCLEFVWQELYPALGDLLLDAHGCYVIKTLLERLPPQEIAMVLQSISADEQLGFSICTHSLHTRRVVQHIIENIDGSFLCDLMSRHCADIAMTQQGCIVMQRAMDNAPPSLAREKLYNAIAINLVNFAKDPFANYVVQHLMEVGERDETSSSMWHAFKGRIVELACNKFASNVIEKCLFHSTAEVQHEVIVEMYSSGPQVLFNMLQDSFGNYIIQSSIALATFRDISFIDEKLRPVLNTTPYGHKIEGRLDRRLKGKPVTSRGPVAAERSAAERSAAERSAPEARARTNLPKHAGANRRADKVPAGEVPW